MARILDQYGNPIQTDALAEPQTSRIAQLQNAYLAAAVDGLTPSRLAAALRAADVGDLAAQHAIFSDMEDRDAHLAAEISKRKLVVQNLEWDIVPPPGATAAEKATAEWVKEILTDAVDPIEDLILALMDGPGHGFAAVELEWRQEGGERLPAFHPRPQGWFRLDSHRRELRLQDGSMDGAAPWTFGWVLHTHGKAKTGYIGRLGLYRCLSWPFIYKAYGIGDFAEFLETYGLPIIVGKYYQGAPAEEKDSLMRAVAALGHDARAIMPADMQLEIQKVTGGGDSTPHLAMVDWCERAQSKAILGQVLSAEAKATGLGGGLANVHNEVRKDIRNFDARQVAATITRDLVYPLIAINRGGIDGLARCPRFRFDTGEAEDMALLAESLPALAGSGMQISVEWAHEKLRIPMAKDGEPTLVGGAVAKPTADAVRGAALAANSVVASGNPPAEFPDQAAVDAALAEILAKLGDPAWFQAVVKALFDAADYADAFERLAQAYPQIDAKDIEALLASAQFAAEAWGRLTAASA